MSSTTTGKGYYRIYRASTLPKLDAIVAERLTKLYGKHAVVDHVSFAVKEGGIFGFLGPNGAGKTTTIKMLTTLLEVSDGRALICGLDVSKHRSEVRRAIGLVPQDLTLDRDMTGRRNLTIQARLYDVPDRAAASKTDELLRLVDLHGVADKEVRTYSWGMQKRLELVMGLVNTPKVLFLDEPTLGLDAQSRSSIWGYIRKLNHDFNVTIFLTTHYLEEADELCDRIAIIDGGKLKTEGSPEQLKRSFGGEVVELELTAPADNQALAPLLGGIPDVIRVSTDGTLCTVETLNAESAIPQLVLTLANNGFGVKTVNAKVASLNQVFLKQIARLKDSDSNQGTEDEYKTMMKERLLNERT